MSTTDQAAQESTHMIWPPFFVLVLSLLWLTQTLNRNGQEQIQRMEGRQNVRETCVASDYGEQCIHIQRHQHPKQVDLFGLAVDVSVATLKGYKNNTKRVMEEERHRVGGKLTCRSKRSRDPRSSFTIAGTRFQRYVVGCGLVWATTSTVRPIDNGSPW